jgi:AcrR family transcriptional regulator
LFNLLHACYQVRVDGAVVTDDPAGAAERRRSAEQAFKREWLVESARAVFAREGIARSSMREIAKNAGYTVGVLYNYFRSKEELYAEVLRGSLATVADRIATATDGAPDGQRAAAGLRAMYGFYRERPGDFDLSFYLFQGARPVGLDAELDARLNALVERVMDELAAGLEADRLAAPGAARSHAVRASSAVFGVILMAHTGRLGSLGEEPDTVLDAMVDDLLGPRAGGDEETAR